MTKISKTCPIIDQNRSNICGNGPTIDSLVTINKIKFQVKFTSGQIAAVPDADVNPTVHIADDGHFLIDSIYFLRVEVMVLYRLNRNFDHRLCLLAQRTRPETRRVDEVITVDGTFNKNIEKRKV